MTFIGLGLGAEQVRMVQVSGLDQPIDFLLPNQACESDFVLRPSDRILFCFFRFGVQLPICEDLVGGAEWRRPLTLFS